MSEPLTVVIHARITAQNVMEVPDLGGRVLVLTLENDQTKMRVNIGFSPNQVNRLRSALAAYQAGPPTPVGQQVSARRVSVLSVDALTPAPESGPDLILPGLGVTLACLCGQPSCKLLNDTIVLTPEDADELAQAILTFQVVNAQRKGEAACPPTPKS